MASELIQDYGFYQLSCAVMATANSVAGTSASTPTSSSDGGGESSIWNVVRRKMSKVQDVLQGFAAPLQRWSMYDEITENALPHAEHIEMSRLEEIHKGRGHIFRPCSLNDATWCDYCGDFIWGLRKQCLRCENCHMTSHERCVPLVNLNCISILEDSALETSLSLGYPHSRPGSAKMVSSLSTDNTTTSGSSAACTSVTPAQQHQYRVSESAPDMQEINRRASLPNSQDHKGPPITAQGQGQQMKHESAVGSNPSTATSDYFSQQRSRHSSPCLQGLPPPPSAIDELTQGNDDARFITSHGKPQHHPISPATFHPNEGQALSSSSSHQQQSPHLNNSNKQTSPPQSSIPPIIEESSHLPSPSPSPTSTSVSAQSHYSPASVSTSGVLEDVSQSSSPVKPEGEAGAEEKDETDSGYRSGTIPDEKLPKVPSQATLDREELKRKIAKYNHFVPAASLEMTGKDSFQGFIKVTMNLIRPITMELGARPPSIYELLTREHIIEENTQQVAFYMPRDTHKSLHITNETTTKDVISSLLKKFHILDHPRKFAMYEQEFNDKNKLVRLRRLTDKIQPLVASVAWDPERIKNYRMVLQEDETGEIVWGAFSLPELSNFLKVLDREEKETITELKHKYAYMKQIMEKRLADIKSGKLQMKKKSSNA